METIVIVTLSGPYQAAFYKIAAANMNPIDPDDYNVQKSTCFPLASIGYNGRSRWRIGTVENNYRQI